MRQRAWILPEYLSALDAIEYGAKQYVFVIDSSTDATERILESWRPAAPVDRVYHHRSNAPGHRRGEYGRDGYAHLAEVRNVLLDQFLDTDAEYLLSVDSDIVVPPDILRQLLPLADERTVVAAAISNIAGKPLDGRIPGNFMIEETVGDQRLIRHPSSYPVEGTLEVAVTGACALYPRSLFEAGVRWGQHRQGEDCSLCAAARAAGFRVLVNFDCRPEHRMVEKVAC